MTGNWRKIADNGIIQGWVSDYKLPDGDYAEVYIEKHGFTLYCFSGIPSSNIYIDVVDYRLLWDKFDIKEELTKYNYIEQALIIAEEFCKLINK